MGLKTLLVPGFFCLVPGIIKNAINNMDNTTKTPSGGFLRKDLTSYQNAVTYSSVIIFLFVFLYAVVTIFTAPELNLKDQELRLAKMQEQAKGPAQKELNEFMALAKRAGLVKSYEFSEMGNIVYADSAWYSQTFSFKQDFMTKISMLKKIITGYRRFEVRDAYSNEKLAEVTAFSGSVEIYK